MCIVLSSMSCFATRFTEDASQRPSPLGRAASIGFLYDMSNIDQLARGVADRLCAVEVLFLHGKGCIALRRNVLKAFL